MTQTLTVTKPGTCLTPIYPPNIPIPTSVYPIHTAASEDWFTLSLRRMPDAGGAPLGRPLFCVTTLDQACRLVAFLPYPHTLIQLLVIYKWKKDSAQRLGQSRLNDSSRMTHPVSQSRAETAHSPAVPTAAHSLTAKYQGCHQPMTLLASPQMPSKSHKHLMQTDDYSSTPTSLCHHINADQNR